MTDDENLPARMLTCAARLKQLIDEQAVIGRDNLVVLDAVELLTRGAQALQVAPASTTRPFQDRTTPLPPTVVDELVSREHAARGVVGPPVWGGLTDPGPAPVRGPASRNACPNCGSFAGKRVFRSGGLWMARCPTCGAAWSAQTKEAGLR